MTELFNQKKKLGNNDVRKTGHQHRADSSMGFLKVGAVSFSNKRPKIITKLKDTAMEELPQPAAVVKPKFKKSSAASPRQEKKLKFGIIGSITLVIVIGLFILLYSPAQKTFFGKAIASGFNVNVECPASAQEGQQIDCRIVLDSDVSGTFAAQFVINALGANALGSGPGNINFAAISGLQGGSASLGGQTVLYKDASSGQSRGTIATFSLRAGSSGTATVSLSELKLAAGSLPARINVQASARCGDRIINGAEACDDGNTASSDGCSNSCAIESGFTCSGTPSNCARSPPSSVCGNNVVETGEVCDGTNLAGRSCNNQGFTGGTLSCSADCQSLNTNLCATALCGNNVVETGEVCDGTSLAGQSCAIQGFTDGTLSCAANCLSFNNRFCVTNSFCGDGRVSSGEEQCDDGNMINGDGCSSGCRQETYNPSMCGDGVAFNFRDNRQEECDGSDLRNLDCTNLGFRGGNLGCSSACRYETSNCDSTNRVVSLNQQPSDDVYCEDSDGGVTASSRGEIIVSGRSTIVSFLDYCVSSTSLLEHFCVQEGNGNSGGNANFLICEGVCENGACVSGPRGICGNGLIERSEQCDDGNTMNEDGCSQGCFIEPRFMRNEQGWSCSGQPSLCVREVCGNGRISGGENCDDANTINGDGCSSACTIEQTYLCSGTPSVCSKTSVGEQRTLVILLDYDNAVESYEGMRSGIRFMMDVFNGYIRDVSFGRAWLSTDIVGPYRVSTADCVQNSRNGEVILQKAIRAADPDVDFNRDYRRIVVLSNDNNPTTICNSLGDNSGSGIIRENEYLSLFAMQTNERRVAASVFRSANFNQNVGNLAHEMGHNFGDILEHVGYMSCSVGGQRTVMNSNLRDCTNSLWSYTDPMGIRIVHYNAANTEFLGWLQLNQAVTATVGSYTLEPLSSSSNGVKLIKIPSQIRRDSDSYNYFLEFRQPTGRDSEQFPGPFPLNGVFLYLQRTGTPGMYLLEPPPYTNPTAFTHKPLPVNQPIILPEGIRITVTSQSSSGARIELS